MIRQITIVGVIVVVWISLVGCRSYQRAKLGGENVSGVRREKQREVGMPDPSAVYCIELGYKLKVVTADKGAQHGVCIFPDGSECEAWAFYRGKCGQEWSCCKRNGYDLKDLGRYEGWFRGAVCIDRTSKKENSGRTCIIE